MENSTSLLNLCGLVLAGGEGKRLESFILRLRGDALPKQFVNFIGTRSMLEHTFSRAEILIPRRRVFTVIAEDHLKYPEVRRQLSARSAGTVIVQPVNRDTGLGIFLPLLHIGRRYPESTLVVFPSDHFMVKESQFMNYVYRAGMAVLQDPTQLVLLAVKPHRIEPEYGYIIPRDAPRHLSHLGLRGVLRFVEKPESDLAGMLTQRGGLWNTMIMVFKVKTLLSLARRICPQLNGPFVRIRDAIGTLKEREVLEREYRRMEPVNFSKEFLEFLALSDPASLSVLPVPDLGWSDWGSERRILSMLNEFGLQMRLNEFQQSGATGSWREEKPDRHIRSIIAR